MHELFTLGVVNKLDIVESWMRQGAQVALRLPLHVAPSLHNNESTCREEHPSGTHQGWTNSSFSL